MRTAIAAWQLLHGFVLDTDSFLSSLGKVVYSRICKTHFCDRRCNRVCTNGTAANSASADLTLSTAFGSAQNLTRIVCGFTQPRIHEVSTGENHEISTFDCSNDGTDERDDDLVQ